MRHVDFTERRNDGTTHNLRLYSNSLEETDFHPYVMDKPLNPQQSFSSDMEAYQKNIKLPQYRQLILAISGIEPETTALTVDPENLTLQVSTSYHLQAIKDGVGRTLTPVSVEGLVLTKDDKLVWGVRGGHVENGTAHLSPAGNLTYRSGGNPIFMFFYDELRKELGVPKEKARYTALIGQQDSPVIKGIGFLLFSEIDKTFNEINEQHQEAYAAYREAKNMGIPELEARAMINNAGFPNVDAWEHVRLFPIENNDSALEKIIQERTVDVDGHRLPTVDVGWGSLFLYKKWQV